jgi:hypothetical protein
MRSGNASSRSKWNNEGMSEVRFDAMEFWSEDPDTLIIGFDLDPDSPESEPMTVGSLGVSVAELRRIIARHERWVVAGVAKNN